jgi:hypothetical protein
MYKWNYSESASSGGYVCIIPGCSGCTQNKISLLLVVETKPESRIWHLQKFSFHRLSCSIYGLHFTETRFTKNSYMRAVFYGAFHLFIG